MQSAPQTSTCHLYATGKLSVTPRCKAANELRLCSSSPSSISGSPKGEGPLSFCFRRLASLLSPILYKRPSTRQPLRKRTNHYYSSHLDDYRLLQELGCGGSAVVFAASYRPRSSLIALKQVDLNRCRISDKEITALRREIHILSRCHHPHIISILRSFTVSHHMYLVMPMMIGSCRDLLTDFLPDGLEESLIACILRQTISGLRYLHVNGVIHRDVKAANILVDQTGIVKLADFGASIMIHDDDPQRTKDHQFLTVPQSASCPCRSFVGTPCWMAPEMIQHLEYTEKVDIWALGITAIELACGSPPFCDGTPATIFSRVIYEPSPTLDDSQYSDNLNDFVSQCLEKDAKKRISADHALHHPFIVSALSHTHLATWLHTLQYSPCANNNTKWSCNNMVSLQAEEEEDDDDDDSAPTTPDDVSPTSLHIPNRNLLLHTPKEFHLF
ncbi:kinase-like protein [Lichtheimia hyalospora FSU 10163]|nr:kinase-like protein [Lichtheimia hyalospora FSU 10163]